MSEQLNEVFDSEGTMPVVNLNPKLKVPQIWKIGDVESQLVARMVSYASEGDAIKQVKAGDKYAHVILMSLSAKGTPAELKGGLGAEPINAINSIFDVVYEQVKRLRMEAIMFRFPTKKMKGQGPIVQRVIQRLVMQKTGGKFKVIPAMYQFTGKHTYVLIAKKSTQIEDIQGMPGINAELYTKVDSDVGEVYVSKKDGVQVTKEIAVAGSIAAVEEKRTDLAAIKRTKISRRAIAASQSLSTDNVFDPKRFEEYEATAAEFSKPVTGPMIEEANELKLAITSKAARNRVINRSTDIAAEDLAEFGGAKNVADAAGAAKFKAEFTRRLGDAPITSVESMQAFVQTLLDTLEESKYEHFERFKAAQHGSDDQREEKAWNLWNLFRTKMIKRSMQVYAGTTSVQIKDITISRTPKHFKAAEKRAIKEYVGSAYRDINDMLLGRYNPENYDILDEEEVVKTIKNLDSAFKVGDRMPEGITLWRAQSVRKPIYDAMVKNRVFYFRNYVSTSLSPIIFGGWKGNAAVGLTSDNTNKVLAVDKNGEGSIITSNDARLVQEYGEERVKVGLGWAITGAEKINVIYPGDLSNMSGEMEVILPRGTMLKINKITDASYNDGMTYSNQKFVQAEVMVASQLDESTVVYDGDALMESGELKVYGEFDMDRAEAEVVDSSFDSFVKSTRVGALTVMASYIDLSDIPEKFVQG